MITKLLLPALAAAVLGACATGYDYRGGNGDYYYGQPSVDYQDDYYGSYGAAGYGYPGGWSGMLGYGMGYGGYGYGGYPYGYGYPYGGYGYPYYPPVIIVRPDPPSSVTGPRRPGQRPPGNPGQGVPSLLHGRGHPWSPSPVAPVADDRQPARVPRFEPTPYPRERIQQDSRQPVLRDTRDIPRPERDDSLKPHR